GAVGDGRRTTAMVREEIVMQGEAPPVRPIDEPVVVLPFRVPLGGGRLDDRPLDRGILRGIQVDRLVDTAAHRDVIEDEVVIEGELHPVVLVAFGSVVLWANTDMANDDVAHVARIRS